jgi:DNA polymerase-3 subunit delta
MSKPLHAVEYLESPQDHRPGGICVVFGDEAFFKRQCLVQLRAQILGGDEGDFSLTTVAGPTALLRDVMQELTTLAMFGGTRMIVVDDADDFVSRYRTELEDYVAKAKPHGVLILDVKSFPSNTRLFKAVAGAGLAIDCSVPPAAKLARWLIGWAQRTHHIQLPAACADQLMEMVGPEVGLLDQELAKLALTVGASGKITSELLDQMVGSWRAKTAWEMLDSLLNGNLRQSLEQLDRLLLAGENAIAILAQISSSLRRLAAATRLIVQGEATGRRIGLRDALQKAGVKPFVLEKSERQLRRLGRQRGDQLDAWLLEADLDLKGASHLPPRIILERLFVRIGMPATGTQPAARP